MMEIRVTDLKQFIFCPRYIYFTYVQPVKKMVTYKMLEGRESHQENVDKEKRRKLISYDLIEGERHFGYPIYSEKLGFRGKVDILIDTLKDNEQRYFPVECKDSLRGIRNNIKYQLVGYALAIEEMTGTNVDRGFIYIIPEKKAYPVKITKGMKDYVIKAITMIHNIVENEIFPDPRSKKRCWNCEVRRYCNDIDAPSQLEKKNSEVNWMRELFGSRLEDNV